MRADRLSLFLILALPGLLLALRPDEPVKKPALDLADGIGPAQVRARLGPPARVSRQVLAHRCIEQWHYGPPHHFRLVFDCPRGQTPRLIGKHPAPGRAP
jgi:hypothetical protein